MKNPHYLFFVFLSIMFLNMTCNADPAAEQVLEKVRLGTVLQKMKLEGHMRKYMSKNKIPLDLSMKGEEITFQFSVNHQWVGFHMVLDQGNAKLYETLNGKASPLPPEKISQPILGSDVTYEDLSLKFLYWKDARIEGEETIKTQRCYRIRLNNPGQYGRYKTVVIWVHKKYSALMQVAGYDATGKLLKRFHITELMKINGIQTLKKMNIEAYKPGTNKVIGITYLEFDKKSAKLKGL